MTATVDVKDTDGDAMEFEWMVTAESTDQSTGGDKERVPPSFPELTKNSKGASCTFTTPSKPGEYRLFLTVHDRKGGAATGNIPFKVR